MKEISLLSIASFAKFRINKLTSIHDLIEETSPEFDVKDIDNYYSADQIIKQNSTLPVTNVFRMMSMCVYSWASSF